MSTLHRASSLTSQQNTWEFKLRLNSVVLSLCAAESHSLPWLCLSSCWSDSGLCPLSGVWWQSPEAPQGRWSCRAAGPTAADWPCADLRQTRGRGWTLTLQEEICAIIDFQIWSWQVTSVWSISFCFWSAWAAYILYSMRCSCSVLVSVPAEGLLELNLLTDSVKHVLLCPVTDTERIGNYLKQMEKLV